MIRIYTQDEIKRVFDSGMMSYNTHMYLKDYIQDGISTYELDCLANDYIVKNGGVSAFYGYSKYPWHICVSINDVVVHGMPSKNEFVRSGDIVGVDLGVNLNGYFSDTAWTWPVGKVSQEAENLIKVTQSSLFYGIRNAGPNKRIRDISYSIQKNVEKNGFSIVRELTGHGIGRSLHEPPSIPNYVMGKSSPAIKEGMIFAIEPMVNSGAREVDFMSDHWTVRTKDRKLSAHFEHTIAVTKDGPLLCTLPKNADVNVFEIMSNRKKLVGKSKVV